jgi:feruloyl esterase
MAEGTVDGYPRQVWWNADGETVVESYTITDMAHGTPLGLAGTDESYGAEGAFLIEAGISSSYHIASFFGLTDRVSQPNDVARPVVKAPIIPSAATVSLQSPDLVATLWPRAAVRQAKPRESKPRENKPQEAKPEHEPKRSIDVSAVIARALTAAGLMK